MLLCLQDVELLKEDLNKECCDVQCSDTEIKRMELLQDFTSKYEQMSNPVLACHHVQPALVQEIADLNGRFKIACGLELLVASVNTNRGVYG